MKHDEHETDGNGECGGEGIQVHDIQHLKEWISEDAAAVTSDECGRKWNSA